MAHNNISIRVQVGEVATPKSYLRIEAHNDQNVRSHIASAIGVQPETGTVFLKVGSSVTNEELDQIFLPATGTAGYTDHVQQGNVQEYPVADGRWATFNLDKVAGGALSESVLPLLSSNPNLGGVLTLAVESEQTGEDFAAFRANNQTHLYSVLKSFRLAFTTTLTADQLSAISEVVEMLVGQKLGGLDKLSTAVFDLDLRFDSFDQVPEELRAGLTDVTPSEAPNDVKNALVGTPLNIIREQVEAHVFLTDSISLKVSAYFPGLQHLKD